MNEIERYIAGLKEVRDFALMGCLPAAHHGICANLSRLLGWDDEAYHLVNAYADAWPKALRYGDGSVQDYCVPHVPDYCKWEWPNLEARLELIDCITGQLYAELAAGRSIPALLEK